MISCRRWLGGEILIPKEQLVHRPSAYGVVRREDTVLLLTAVGENGRYCLPGGGTEPWETNAEALQRELMEETGIQVEVGSLLHFREDFFYYDPKDEALHGLLFYYVCRPLTFNLLSSEEVDDESVTSPQWVTINTLNEGNLQLQEMWLLNYFGDK
ncbi:NUDIX domain-containing protein [Candidatus Leptofilum sp.]|uniref:NUDIX domain-containing protein n=1 Tax=Candidatus Leptofilum sp. TaxID=3241576 RepID=UPI003B58F9BE